MSALQVTWFILIAFLLTGFAVLSGFDLGAGILQFFVRKDEERNRLFAAIGPFWDGNEVWLIAGGGALFAAFPPVYAGVFSGFYLALMLLLAALVLRAVSIDFGGRDTSEKGRTYWAYTVAVCSALAVLLLGVAFGNILRGVLLDEKGNFTGTFFTLLNPFAIVVGLLNLAMIVTHGAIYTAMKTTGVFADKARRWASRAWVLYFLLVLATFAVAAIWHTHLLVNFRAANGLLLVPALALLAITFAGVWNSEGTSRRAFLASCLGIIGLMATAAIALFPRLVPALGNLSRSLTAANASSSPLTLKVMLIATVIGMAIVLGYTTWLYRTFGGKIEEGAKYE